MAIFISSHGRASRLGASNLPSPKEAEALPVPGNDCLTIKTLDTPVVPDTAWPSPQESISGVEFRQLHGTVKDSELMAQSKVLKLKRRTAPE
jgi:hypothetical protein